jgi:hypothetical protein
MAHNSGLTASLIAGSEALEGLCSQKLIPTTNWRDLKAEPINNHNNYSDANQFMAFTFENGTRVEVEVITWKRNIGDVVKEDIGREWSPRHVYVEKDGRMRAYVYHIGEKGYLWSRWPELDKSLPGVTWRDPTTEEIAAYKTAIAIRDEDSFLNVYYADLIAWEKHNDHLGKNTQWVHTTLLKAA